MEEKQNPKRRKRVNGRIDKYRKEDLITMLREKGYTKQDALVIYEDFVNVLIQAIMADKPVSLRGFGTFYIKTYSNRVQWDIGAQKAIEHPPISKVKFAQGAVLAQAVKAATGAAGVAGIIEEEEDEDAED